MFNIDVEMFSIVAIDHIIQRAKQVTAIEDTEQHIGEEQKYDTNPLYLYGFANGLIEAYKIITATNEQYREFADEEERKAKWDEIYRQRPDNVDNQ